MNPLIIANTQIRRDALNRYSLNDLHQASGGEPRHRPGRWLDSDKTRELVAELQGETAGIPAVSEPVVSVEGRLGGTYAVKELVYAYAMWISAKFHLHVIRAYDALVTGNTRERPAPDRELADATVNAVRNFTAILRAARASGRDRVRALIQANRDTLEHFGVDLFERGDLADLATTKALPAADEANSVAAFALELLDGRLGLPLGPALSVDVVAVYRVWCRRNGWRAYATARFVHGLSRDLRIPVYRKRYQRGGRVVGPHSVMYLGDAHSLHLEPTALATALDRFTQAMHDYAAETEVIAA